MSVRALARGFPAGALALFAAVIGAPLAAQQSLLPAATITVSPTFDVWRFADGLPQPGANGNAGALISRVQQWSFPLTVSVPVGERWTVEAAAAYAAGRVTLAEPDTALGVSHYDLRGLTDVRLRAVGRLSGDNVLLTVGVNAPSGAKRLDDASYQALRVLAAPALGFETPALGTGPGATLGLVGAERVGSWALGIGASYEVRGTYVPVATFPTSASAPDFRPGNALHLSLGADGFAGQSRVSLGVTADFFAADELTTTDAGGAERRATVGLGPSVTAEGQLRIAARAFRELTLYVSDRYRWRYSRDGVAVEGSRGNYLDAGLRSVYPLAPSLGLLTTISVASQSGLAADQSVAAAGVLRGALTLGLASEMGAYTLTPFLRGQVGRFDTGAVRRTGTGLGAGLALSRRL